MIYHKKCLICNSLDLKPLPKYKNAFLVKCQKCSFVFSNKIPQQQELNKHYSQYPRYDKISNITLNRYHSLLNVLEKYRKNNNLLDIGCGNGHFLKVAKERGWNVFGTEFTEQAVEICQSKGITCYKGALINLNIKKTFDVITSFEVIEHINNQLEELAVIHDLIRTKGAFYVTTPNFNSISRFILKSNWRVIEYPEHLAYFTPKTLNDLFFKFNFNNKKLITTGIEIHEIKNIFIKNKASQIKSRQQKEKVREIFETKSTAKLSKSIINSFLTTFYIGDTIKALYEKNV